MKRDAVKQLMTVVQSVAKLDSVTVAAVENAIRREFEGQRLLVNRRAPVTIEDVNLRLRARMPVAAIASDLGLSRASVYRMLGGIRKKSRKYPSVETSISSE